MGRRRKANKRNKTSSSPVPGATNAPAPQEEQDDAKAPTKLTWKDCGKIFAVFFIVFAFVGWRHGSQDRFEQRFLREAALNDLRLESINSDYFLTGEEARFQLVCPTPHGEFIWQIGSTTVEHPFLTPDAVKPGDGGFFAHGGAVLEGFLVGGSTGFSYWRVSDAIKDYGIPGGEGGWAKLKEQTKRTVMMIGGAVSGYWFGYEIGAGRGVDPKSKEFTDYLAAAGNWTELSQLFFLRGNHELREKSRPAFVPAGQPDSETEIRAVKNYLDNLNQAEELATASGDLMTRMKSTARCDRELQKRVHDFCTKSQPLVNKDFEALEASRRMHAADGRRWVLHSSAITPYQEDQWSVKYLLAWLEGEGHSMFPRDDIESALFRLTMCAGSRKAQLLARFHADRPGAVWWLQNERKRVLDEASKQIKQEGVGGR